MTADYVPGQRWISEAEPELGLGTIMAADRSEVCVHFASREVSRTYACESAPLRRIEFRTGDRIKSRNDQVLSVENVATENGLLSYIGQGLCIHEKDLAENTDFSGPEERLALGQIDSNSLFDLRLDLHEKRQWLEALDVRGLIGPRISLLPHQLFVASEVGRRYQARVLLGDEVGLGKTIEAGLILHRQIQTGTCNRVLILLPESLTHQWFLELWRRFNLTFSIFDEPRCQSIEERGEAQSPFYDSSLVICSIEFLTENSRRTEQVRSTDWDILVVDEAHHLSWNEVDQSAEYELVESLSQSIPGVMLLTGTPQQLGESGHFARLRLLDPKRFHSLRDFLCEQDQYSSIAGIVGKLMDSTEMHRDEINRLITICDGDPETFCTEVSAGIQRDAEIRNRLTSMLIDRHGTGRIFFRNRRDHVPGFPKRIPLLQELSLSQPCMEYYSCGSLEAGLIAPEFRFGSPDWQDWWLNDLRIETVLNLLEKYSDQKMLLLCARRESVLAIDQAIQARVNVQTAIFHEDLSLTVRDRNAAYFAKSDGARLLICSEIGSEGRNFQFCHHLILFDLPLNPDLLEQRIGRLDRIGQNENVVIHVLYFRETAQEVIAKWYRDGLGAFENPIRSGSKLYEEIGHRVRTIANRWPDEDPDETLSSLISDTKNLKKKLEKKLASGRDRLLDWYSHRPEIGSKLVDEIEFIDSRSDLLTVMEKLCEHLGVVVEDHDYDGWFLRPGDLYQGLPGLPDEGIPVTFSRSRGLAREDVEFLSWEHPMVIGAVDQLLGSPGGRASYGFWEDSKSRAILLEAVFVLYCTAPEWCRPERFLPPTPIRVLVDHLGHDQTNEIGRSVLQKRLLDDPTAHMLRKPEVTQQLLPTMLARCRDLVELRKRDLVEPAITEMRASLLQEIDRLEGLRAAQAPVRDDEINHFRNEMEQLEIHFSNAAIRLDAIRLIWRGDLGGRN